MESGNSSAGRPGRRAEKGGDSIISEIASGSNRAHKVYSAVDSSQPVNIQCQGGEVDSATAITRGTGASWVKRPSFEGPNQSHIVHGAYHVGLPYPSD